MADPENPRRHVSRFTRWMITPAIVWFVILMPLLIPHWTVVAVLAMAMLTMLCLSALGGMWLPRPASDWALRIFTAQIFLIFSIYLVHELFFAGNSLGSAMQSPALPGFVAIGLPCAWYAAFGEFKSRIVREQRSICRVSPDRIVADHLEVDSGKSTVDPSENAAKSHV